MQPLQEGSFKWRLKSEESESSPTWLLGLLIVNVLLIVQLHYILPTILGLLLSHTSLLLLLATTSTAVNAL